MFWCVCLGVCVCVCVCVCNLIKTTSTEQRNIPEFGEVPFFYLLHCYPQTRINCIAFLVFVRLFGLNNNNLHIFMYQHKSDSSQSLTLISDQQSLETRVYLHLLIWSLLMRFNFYVTFTQRAAVLLCGVQSVCMRVCVSTAPCQEIPDTEQI